MTARDASSEEQETTPDSWSNCLLAILRIQPYLGGRVRWWPGWNNGWRDWHLHPWGHFYLEVSPDVFVHFSSVGKNLPWWRQLWFRGRYHIDNKPHGGDTREDVRLQE